MLTRLMTVHVMEAINYEGKVREGVPTKKGFASFIHLKDALDGKFIDNSFRLFIYGLPLILI